MNGTMTMPGGWEMSMAWMRMPGQSRIGAAAMFLTMWQHHGAYCAGCCWALMLIQLAIGVMNVSLMAVLAGVIWIEKKLAPRRTDGGRCRRGGDRNWHDHGCLAVAA
jgi:Predicted metal-binding integral membrane protein (DUF2182)